MARSGHLVSAVVVAAAVLLTSGSSRAQTQDAPASPVNDAGAPTDVSSPPTQAPPAAPPAAAPAPSAVPSPAPDAVVLPVLMMNPTAPSSPPPAAPPSFGRRGQIAILGGSSLGASSSTFGGSSAAHASYTVSPDVDYFVARNVSIGLALGASYADSKGYGADGSLVDTRTTTLSGGPRFGVNLPLGGVLSFYPRVTVGFEWTRTAEQLVSGQSLSIAASALGSPETTQFGPYVDVDANLLLHATDHLFFGLGPTFFHDFGSVSGQPSIGGQRTEIGAGFVVGGYWGGDRGPSDPPIVSNAPAPRPPRFGDAGQFVVSNDLVLSADWLTYAGTDSTSRNISVGGSLDYFVVDHVSVGVAAGVSSSYSRGIDSASGAVVTTSNTVVSFAPRLGVNVPLGTAFSIYPQFALGIGHGAFHETSGPSQDDYVSDIISVSLFVPVLVHPAPHFFVGLGPSLYTEVSDAETVPGDPLAPAVQNKETTLGAGLIVGGWL